jgi:hypothetical protein
MVSVRAELARYGQYAQILEIDPGFKGDFSIGEKSLRKKIGEGLARFFLGEEPEIGFQEILETLRQKAIFEDKDRQRKKEANIDLDPNNIQFSRYGGTPGSNRAKNVEYFPDIEDENQGEGNNIPIPTADYFSNFGVDSFTELEEEFYPNHFENIPVLIDNSSSPEIKWLIRQIRSNQELLNGLNTLLQSGHFNVYIQKMKQTPEKILRSIRMISMTQEKWTITWLPAVIESEKIPNFGEKKSDGNGSDSETGENSEGQTEGQMLTDSKIFDHLRKLFTTEEYLTQMARSIVFIRDESLRFVVESKNGGEIPKNVRNLVDKINEILVPLRTEYAKRKLQFDYSFERTDYPRKILKALFVFGTLAEILEDLFELPRIAKALAGSGDDLLGEMGEIHALMAQGFTLEEIVSKRIGILIPAALGAFYLSYKTVQDLIDRGDFFWAGVAFGSASVLLSFVTAVQSIKMFKEGLDKLIAEDKVPTMTNMKRWIEAFKQDFNNPLRAGIFVGVLASPIIAGIAGEMGLFNYPFLLPLFGQAESFGGLVSSVMAKSLFERKWKKLCDNDKKNNKKIHLSD